MSRKVIGVVGAIIGISLAAACGSEPKLEVSKTQVPYFGSIIAQALEIKNLEEKELEITDIKFPKQDCRLENSTADRMKNKKNTTLKYGQTQTYMYLCKDNTDLMHVEVYTSRGDMEYSWAGE